MLDEQKFIGAQAIMKSLIESKAIKVPETSLSIVFSEIMKIIEDYATIPEGEEFVNTEIPIPKEFWNQTPQTQTQWLTEWGKPMPVVNKVGRKEWFVHTKRVNLAKVKKVFEDRENNFADMVKKHEDKV